MRLRTYWESERVLNEICLLRENSIPLFPKYVLKHYAAVFSAARVIFGPWRNALIAADIEVPDAVPDGRRGILRALHDALAQHSEADIPARLKLHAMYYFGSLEKAKGCLEERPEIRRWMEQSQDHCAIHKRHRSGQALGYAASRRDNPALVSAAEAYFGTWGNGLYAVGIDPTFYLRGKWRKRRMIAKRDRNQGRGLAP
jgi:hypothetical protein